MTASAFATQVFLAVSLVVFVLAVIAAALKYPKVAAGYVVFFLLVVAFGKSHAATAEIAVIVDDAAIDRATVERELAAASAIMEQAGIKLVLGSYTVKNIATHTNPIALLQAVNEYKLAQNGASGDIYVFLTSRKLSTGSVLYAGMATTGPACAARSAAVVQMRYDGTDSLTLAHEIAHTFGVEHDTVRGYLMAPGDGATSTMSPDTLGVLRGALLDCMPDPTSSVAAKEQPSSGSSGGGGSVDDIVVGLLLALLIIRRTRKS